MKKMEKDIFNIIEAKDYSQLSTEELDMIAEFCQNEDEYRQMKSVLLGVSSMNLAATESPRQATKDKLDDLFAAQTFPKAAPIWYNKIGMMLYPRDKKMYQRPLFQLAAIFILLLGIVPFLVTSNHDLKKEQLAQNEMEAPSTNDEYESVESKEVKVTEDLREKNVNSELIQNNEEKSMETSQDKFMLFDEVASAPKKSDKDFNDMSMDATVAAMSRSATSNHPDGVFTGSSKASMPKYSIPLSEQEDVLDLLTATF